MTLAKDGLPDKNVWLIIKRTLGNTPDYSFYISNAPISKRLPTFVWPSGLRWAIEQCFEEAKSELGMGQYEVRKYAGWNHYMLMVMLAHYFLWHLKIRLGKKASELTLSQLRRILVAILPLRLFTLEETLNLIAWVQTKNMRATKSHRKRKIRELEAYNHM